MEKICKNCRFCGTYAPWIGYCRSAGTRVEYNERGCGNFRPADAKKIQQVEDFLKKHDAKIKEIDEKVKKMVRDNNNDAADLSKITVRRFKK